MKRLTRQFNFQVTLSKNGVPQEGFTTNAIATTQKAAQSKVEKEYAKKYPAKDGYVMIVTPAW